jgi:hypothetical protein
MHNTLQESYVHTEQEIQKDPVKKSKVITLDKKNMTESSPTELSDNLENKKVEHLPAPLLEFEEPEPIKAIEDNIAYDNSTTEDNIEYANTTEDNIEYANTTEDNIEYANTTEDNIEYTNTTEDNIEYANTTESP